MTCVRPSSSGWLLGVGVGWGEQMPARRSAGQWEHALYYIKTDPRLRVRPGSFRGGLLGHRPHAPAQDGDAGQFP